MTTTQLIPLSRIHPGPNIRDHTRGLNELAASIAEVGLLQPITVRPHPTLPGHYVTVTGRRRYEAAKRAGADRLPCTVRMFASVDDALTVQGIENLQRDDMTPVEKARYFAHLRDKRGWPQALIASRLGVSPSTVSYYLMLLGADETTLQRVQNEELSAAEVVTAVRATRRVTGAAGPRHAKPSRLPAPQARRAKPLMDWWGPQHPLAEQARVACELVGHPNSIKIGGACGEHWEQVIRADERRSERARRAQLSVLGTAS